MPTPVILDCDTGTDDAVAIMFAARHPKLELLGVTTVWGNHDVAHTTDNTLRVLDLLGRGDIGVHPGANGPFRPRVEPLPSGRSDLPAMLALPPPTSTASSPAVEWMLQTLRASTEPVTFVATGPLTNLAAALAADPDVTGLLGRVVVLGGSHREPGVTRYAERNVWCDPHAASEVVSAGFGDLTLVTMDATFSAPLTNADAQRLRAGGIAGAVAADFVAERIAWYRRDPAMAKLGAAPLHDPLAVACLVDSDVMSLRAASAVVELTDEERYGATTFDFAAARPTMRVALAADHDRYLDLLCQALN